MNDKFFDIIRRFHRDVLVYNVCRLILQELTGR